MHVFQKIVPLRQFLGQAENQQKSIGFVPTMGAIHEGHLKLIREAKAGNDMVVASIYVNPTQFNNPADLQKYPRTINKDIALLTAAGCDILFCPDDQEMYPQPAKMTFDFGPLDKILEGAFRPGHFSGVALVVSKLFNIVMPRKAYFGQKDFQQFRIISQLVDELRFDLQLVCVPTMREPNGLAMSSRNARLREDEREKALVLVQSLTYAKAEVQKKNDLKKIRNEIQKRCEDEEVKLEYLELADRKNLNILSSVKGNDNAILMMAAYVGEVRLIDNVFVNEN
jgi:pantoate--beta-alanine ligase